MRRRRSVEEPAIHDRWLVSYSDFITLLFAFFVVLFASAYRDSRPIVKVSHAIQNGFQTMGAFSDVSPAPGAGKGTRNSAPIDTVQNVQTEGELVGPDAKDIAELRRQLEAAMGAELKSHEVELRVTPEGFVISLKELGFFDSGQAVLLAGGAGKLQRIATILTKHGLDIRVEGHSDNQPIHNEHFRSNWELSTARAEAVLLLLVGDSGFDPSKVSIAGYGQYRPIADNSTPEGRRMNRRVDLVIVAPRDRLAQNN